MGRAARVKCRANMLTQKTTKTVARTGKVIGVSNEESDMPGNSEADDALPRSGMM
jgi:hypothetical protein